MSLGSLQSIGTFSAGGYGGAVISGTSGYTGNFNAVKFLEDTTASINGNISGLSGFNKTYYGGDTIFGGFTSITLSTGSVIVYFS